jgi:hypothetical protein
LIRDRARLASGATAQAELFLAADLFAEALRFAFPL